MSKLRIFFFCTLNGELKSLLRLILAAHRDDYLISDALTDHTLHVSRWQ